MWNFVNFTKFTPLELSIFWSALFKSMGSKKSFTECYEIQSLKFEQEDSVIHKLDPMITMYAGVIFSLVTSLVLCIRKNSREILIKYLRECKQTMIWNGSIAFLDACLIGYCLQLKSSFSAIYDENNDVPNKIGAVVKTIVYTFVVFIT